MSYQDYSPATNLAVSANAERREMQCRRHHSWRTLTYCGFQGRGRRRHPRRSGCDYYLDWYDPGLVFTGLAVIVMSSLDALLTLVLLDMGAKEVNYLMARLMEISDELFLAVKLAVTSVCIIFLLMHSHFRILRIISGKHLLQMTAVVYGLLIGYELILLVVMNG